MLKKNSDNEGDAMKKRGTLKRVIHAVLIAALIFTAVIPTALPSSAATPKLQATAYVKVKKGAALRKTAAAKGKVVKKLKYNNKLKIYSELFTSKTSPKAKYRWYYAAYGSKKGYIRSDMVKNVKFTTKKAHATDYLYYRVGVGKKMKRKGMFNKKASVNVVIPAYQKGSKEKWYKVKVGKNYYYSCATWIKFGSATSTTKKSTPTTSVSKPKTTDTSTDTSTVPASNNSDPDNTALSYSVTSDTTFPTALGKGCPFSIRGKVKSNKEISVGATLVVKPNGDKVICVKKKIDSKTFDISITDSEVKFGTLAAGKYKYQVKIYVDGKWYAALNKSFTVVSGKKAKLITDKAFQLAWPAGTADRKYEYKTGKPTAAYKKALSQVYPNRSRWGAAPRVGASCDVFVGTVLRASGVDTQVPRGLDDQMKYYAKSKRWARIKYNGNKNILRSGDVIIMERPGNGGAHTFIYVAKNGKTYLAEAGYKQMYGRVCSGGTRDYQLKAMKGRKFFVYRIID